VFVNEKEKIEMLKGNYYKLNLMIMKEEDGDNEYDHLSS
jgi:hypothetical protein